ncbi:MAG: aspartate carbamoyltransferase regulatory subunit [Thermoplasmata archaeon]|nr:MAG: aspartate carbamoyltransferase regulatory subunit [Thermoplasmata archaeon]
MKKELKIPRIKDGTVIDHITAGQALKVLRILGIPEGTKSIVSVAMYVKSKKMGKKDIVKVENRELDPEEVNKIALIAPKATINIIRDYKVAKKFRVHIPDEIVGIVRCPNPNCISNSEEPIESRFVVVRRDPLVIKCYYCERKPDNIADNII